MRGPKGERGSAGVKDERGSRGERGLRGPKGESSFDKDTFYKLLIKAMPDLTYEPQRRKALLRYVIEDPTHDCVEDADGKISIIRDRGRLRNYTEYEPTVTDQRATVCAKKDIIKETINKEII